MEDFPSGQVVKTPCSQRRGHRLNSQSGKTPRDTAKKIMYVNDIHFSFFLPETCTHMHTCAQTCTSYMHVCVYTPSIYPACLCQLTPVC